MNFNSDFDLKKAKSFLLTEGKEDYGTNALTGKPLPKPDPVVEAEEYRMGIFDDIDADLMDEEDRIGYLKAIIDYCNQEINSIDLDESVSLEEMAKLTDKNDKNTPLGEKVADFIKKNPELKASKLLNALKADPEISKMLNNSDGETIYQHQLNQFVGKIDGSREIGPRGRKADPNKPAAAPKSEKSPKVKITNPKSTAKTAAPTSKLADLAPTSVFGGGEEDEEDMAAEKQAVAAAKGGKRLGSAAEKLAQVTKEMKALIPAYQAAKGTPEAEAIVAQLKALTAEKKALEAKAFK